MIDAIRKAICTRRERREKLRAEEAERQIWRDIAAFGRVGYLAELQEREAHHD